MTALAGSAWRPGLPPGVYERSRVTPLPGTVSLDTAVFVGLCERGPLATPVVLESWEAYRRIFGRSNPDRKLPDCVRLFFDNGGRRCVVLRTLHAKAAAARWELPAWLVSGGARVSLFARSLGGWGNGIRGTLGLASRLSGVKPAVAPMAPPGPWDGFRLEGRGLTSLDPVRGSVLRFEAPHPAAPVYRTVVAASLDANGTSLLELGVPLPVEYRAGETVARAREILLELDLETEGYSERFSGLGLDSAHPRFLPRVLASPSPHEDLADYREARDRGWPFGDLQAVYLGGDPGGESEKLPSGSALVAPHRDAFAGPLSIDESVYDDGRSPLDRRTPLAALPAAESTEAGDTFLRDDFALFRDALSRHEDRFPYQPGALYCLPDLMHPGGDETERYADPAPERPTRFGACGPGVPEPEYSRRVAYPRLSLANGSAEVLRVQHEWLDWLSMRREQGWPAIALFDAPPDSDAQDLIKFRRGLAADCAALYAPWIHSAAPTTEGGDLRLLPPSPIAAAMAAVAEREAGPYAAPAHRETHGLASLYVNGRLPGPGFLHEERINALRETEVGIRLLGSRTTSLDRDWTHLNVRRLIDRLKRQLALESRWAVFEPNLGVLRSRLRQAVERRLRLLFEKGAFAGRTPADAYFVRVRGDRAEAGELIVEVGVAPSVPMEFIVFELVPPVPEGFLLEASRA